MFGETIIIYAKGLESSYYRTINRWRILFYCTYELHARCGVRLLPDNERPSRPTNKSFLFIPIFDIFEWVYKSLCSVLRSALFWKKLINQIKKSPKRRTVVLSSQTAFWHPLLLLFKTQPVASLSVDYKMQQNRRTDKYNVSTIPYR